MAIIKDDYYRGMVNIFTDSHFIKFVQSVCMSFTKEDIYMIKNLILTMLCCFLGMNALKAAQTTLPVEGEQYIQIAHQIPDAPAVVEFFSFYCPPCYAFSERYGVSEAVNRILPADAQVVKYHVSSMGKLGEELTEAWSVARVLGVESQVEIPLFKAVQKEGQIQNKADIRRVFLDSGVPAEQFDSAMNSMVVRAMTASQIKYSKDFDVSATPSFFVKGKYLVRNNGIIATTEEEYGTDFATVVSFLLQK